MEMLLTNTTMIDAQYLIALGKAGGILPRWQEIPEEAKIDRRNVWRLRFWHDSGDLPVLVWSYCWFNQFHPDPKGEQLQNVLPILEIMVERAKEFSEHCTIGVVQDYGSMPQWPRTREENDRFDGGLKKELNLWYSHPRTNVLMLDKPASIAPEHTNRRLYNERGWCFTEERLATAVKSSRSFWRLSLLNTEEISQRGASRLASIQQHIAAGDMDPSFDASDEHLRQIWVRERYQAMSLQLAAQRPVPVSPEDFAATMRNAAQSGSLSFTAPADMEFVIELYRKGFITAFDNVFGGVWSSNNQATLRWAMPWGDRQKEPLANSIKYISEHCPFTAWRNHQGDRPLIRIKGRFTRDVCDEFDQMSQDFPNGVAIDIDM